MYIMRFKPSPIKALLIAQFFSAFVDNMILFIAQAIINRDAYPVYYLPLVQSMFLFSYIVLSPWVGRFADKKAKSTVLIIGNLIKTMGIILLLMHCNPAFSYAVVGVGAVIYSPAKYGILPLLTKGDDALLRANSSLESFTIIAILLGSVLGGYLSDISITVALYVCVLLYGVSVAINTLIPKDAGNGNIDYSNAVREFINDAAALFRNRQSHYSLIGTGSFWLASAVLRMIVFAWLPLTFAITNGRDISMIIAVSGVGIAIGAAITPHLITVKTYYRTTWFGLGMGACIFTFAFVKSLPVMIGILLLVGCMGGIFIVPMNACLQQVGHQTVGAGKTIAVQNFIENVFMFVGVMAYTVVTKVGISSEWSLIAVGVIMFLCVGYLRTILIKNI